MPFEKTKKQEKQYFGLGFVISGEVETKKQTEQYLDSNLTFR